MTFLGRFEEPQHHRMRLRDYGGFRGSHRPHRLTPVEQSSAVPGRGEGYDKSEEAVGQRQPHQVGEGKIRAYVIKTPPFSPGKASYHPRNIKTLLRVKITLKEKTMCTFKEVSTVPRTWGRPSEIRDVFAEIINPERCYETKKDNHAILL